MMSKYYYSVDDYFSQPGTKGSNYLDVTGTYDLGGGWAAGGYLKHTDAKESSYTVLGKDLGKAHLVGFVSKSF